MTQEQTIERLRDQLANALDRRGRACTTSEWVQDGCTMRDALDQLVKLGCDGDAELDRAQERVDAMGADL